jgi:hypothetical protein
MDSGEGKLGETAKEFRWQLAFGTAVLNDALDLAGIGAIPVIGDVIDVASTAMLWKLLGRDYSIPTILEFIPGLDFLPTYTVTVIFAYYREEYK